MNTITTQTIDARVDSINYTRIPNTTLTICTITMVNGFTVIGHSACVDPARFNQQMGEEIAYENAFEKLWELEGYLLAERVYQEKIKEANDGDSIDNNQ